MKISETIIRLEAYKAKFGDVELLADENDGRSSWCACYVPVIKPDGAGAYFISQSPYGTDKGVK